MALVAWSDIKHHDKLTRQGEEIDKSDFSDDELEELMAAGVVRDSKHIEFPKNIRNTESPKTAMLRDARERFEAAQQPYDASGNNEKKKEPEVRSDGTAEPLGFLK